MRPIYLTLAAFAPVALLSAASAGAQDKVATTAAPFLSLGVGARGVGMGSAQTASAEGPSALYWNPAAVTSMTTSGAEFSTTGWLVGTTFQNAAVVYNAGSMGHLGLSVTALNYGSDEVTTIDRPEGTGEQWSGLDLAVGVSYARPLTNRFSVGGSVKFVQQRIWNETDNGVALDLGVNYLTSFRGLRIGATMTNFGTDLRLQGRDLRQAIDVDPNNNGNNPRNPGYLETDAWALPLTFRVGVSMDAYRQNEHRILVSADALAPGDNAQAASFGAEYGFRDLFYLRGGYRQAFASQVEDQGWAAGFGVRYGFSERLAVRADYVFQEMRPFGTPQTLTVGVQF